MEIWAIIVIMILVLALGGMIGLTYWTEYQNSKEQQNNILYPFSGFIDPTDTEKPVRLTRAPDGKPQLSCPTGSKINIVGAWVEVNDPFGECSVPGATFRATCGDDSNPTVKCTNSADCGEGMDCVGGRCVPATCSSSRECGEHSCPVDPGHPCKTNSDCKGDPMRCIGGKCQVVPKFGSCGFCLDGRCAQAPTCSNLNSKYQNTTCAVTNKKTKCRPRDASAYLAEACDGKQVCDLSWNPLSPKYFGPLPCQISPRNVEYSTLPIIPGWAGGKPYEGNEGSEKANYKQGYYVHGLISCISE